MIESFHTDMNGMVQFNGSSSEQFDIRTSVKQDYALYSGVGKCIRHELKGPICVPSQMTRSSHSPVSEPIPKYTRIRDMLFADVAAVATQTKQELQSLMDHFSQVCTDFGLTISLKTNLMGQDTEVPAVAITVEFNQYTLVVKVLLCSSKMKVVVS